MISFSTLRRGLARVLADPRRVVHMIGNLPTFRRPFPTPARSGGRVERVSGPTTEETDPYLSKTEGETTTTGAFPGSWRYWERRYATGGNSGDGSYGKLAEFKAEVINAFVAFNQVATVLEFGCGDGNQLVLASYPKYVGYDVSAVAISWCRDRFRDDETKEFRLMREYSGEKAELALSLDVIFHLVEDDVFMEYMSILFGAANRFVIIYSSNHEDNVEYQASHVKHRKFSQWVEENAAEWSLLANVPNRYPYGAVAKTGSFAEFFFYSRS